MTAHLFPSKALKPQNMYIIWGLFNTHDSKIWKLIFRLNDITEYLKHFPLFGTDQVLYEENILRSSSFPYCKRGKVVYLLRGLTWKPIASMSLNSYARKLIKPSKSSRIRVMGHTPIKKLCGDRTNQPCLLKEKGRTIMPTLKRACKD